MRDYRSSTSTNVAQAPLSQRTVTLNVWPGQVDTLPLNGKHYLLPAISPLDYYFQTLIGYIITPLLFLMRSNMSQILPLRRRSSHCHLFLFTNSVVSFSIYLMLHLFTWYIWALLSSWKYPPRYDNTQTLKHSKKAGCSGSHFRY